MQKIFVISGYSEVQDPQEAGQLYQRGFTLLESYTQVLSILRGGVGGKGELQGDWKVGQERALKGKTLDSFHQLSFSQVSENPGGWVLVNGYLAEPQHQIQDIDLDYEIHLKKHHNSYVLNVTICLSEALLQRIKATDSTLQELFNRVTDHFKFEVAYLLESRDTALPSLYYASLMLSPEHTEYDKAVAKYIRYHPLGFKNKLYFDAQTLFLSDTFLRSNSSWDEIEKKNHAQLSVRKAEAGKYIELHSSLLPLIHQTQLSIDEAEGAPAQLSPSLMKFLLFLVVSLIMVILNTS